MKPVIPHPTIDHGIHGHRNLERRMRVHQSHQRQKAVIGNPENAHLAVALGGILHQPVDGVVGVGGVIDRRGVLWPMQGPVHYVVALRTKLAADILHHANVATLNDHVGGIVVAVQNWAEVRAMSMAREFVGAVRRARQQNGRALGPLGHQDDCVQLNPVAHRDHDIAPDVVKTTACGLEFRGSFAGIPGSLGDRRLNKTRCSQRANQTSSTDCQKKTNHCGPDKLAHLSLTSRTGECNGAEAR